MDEVKEVVSDREEILTILEQTQRVPYDTVIRYTIRPGLCEEVGYEDVGSLHFTLYKKDEFNASVYTENGEDIEAILFHILTDEHWLVVFKISDPTLKLSFFGERSDIIQKYVADVKVSTSKDNTTLMAIYFNKIDENRTFDIELRRTI